MKSRHNYLGFISKMIFLFSLLINFSTTAQVTAADERVFDYAEDNQKCLKCHGHRTYYYYNETMDKTIKERMNPYFIVDSVQFYNSNHWNFACTDCHSPEFENFPHLGELRMEPKATCLDCHGGDETYASYHFEEIEIEFAESVHSTKHSEEFTCWMCHNPHSYKINARNFNIKETIIYDNNICLSCHADIDKYQLISDKQNPNILEKHEWLPNQSLHFASVRCIECHAKSNDSILVSHLIQPKELAVKKCVECHSQNSILMASLYKFQIMEDRSKLGFSNAALLDNAYLIGANRNYYLNVISIVFYGLILLVILIHAFLRITLK
jgi:Zn finger protein HypA/HybF involved in hydrogenase expression